MIYPSDDQYCGETELPRDPCSGPCGGDGGERAMGGKSGETDCLNMCIVEGSID
jgi:hypothetical protein